MIIVTGGAGFIGSNLVAALNADGRDDIVIVDDLTDGSKYRNINGCRIADFIDMETFRNLIDGDSTFGSIEAVFHEGACTDTTEWDGRYMMSVNYDYSKSLLHYCQRHRVPLVYASSGAVYGTNQVFDETAAIERPANVYGWSKWLFDQYVARRWSEFSSQVVGLRYFNVYGQNEAHKGKMASLVWQWRNQLADTGRINLFGASHGYAAGEQERDFILVDDIAAVNLWFLQRPSASGIFNLGTGRRRSFNDLAQQVIDWHGHGEIDYIPFPEHLRPSYQAFTEADLTRLRNLGCGHAFRTIEDGVPLYLGRLAQPIA